MIDFERWDTPFTEARSPSVQAIAIGRDDVSLLLVVAPGGFDKYPKYIVSFNAVYAYGAAEEAGADSFADCLAGEPQESLGCAFIWLASPQAAAYQRFVPDMPFRGGRGPVRHYVVLGGDDIVGVISAEPPTIETVHGPRDLNMTVKL